MSRPGDALHVLQVNTADRGGGAARVAWNLFAALRARGHRSEMAVGFRHGDDPDVRPIAPRARGGPWARAWGGVAEAWMARFPSWRGTPAAVRAARRAAAPGSLLDAWQGRECFRFPGTAELLDGPEGPPDLVHLHNLHGHYFDLGALPALSQRVPLLATLHDPWMLTGHCAYTLGCDRWREGCGACPHLDTFPPLRRDGTAGNWRRKQAIYARTRLRVATPSRWLLEKVEASMLAPAVVEARVVPNGVDLAVFRPGDRQAARRRLGVGPDALVLVFAAHRFRHPRSWKDWPTVREAVARASERIDTPLHLVALGDAAEPRERLGRARVHAVPYVEDAAEVAAHLQAADVALHAARPEAENYPNGVLEALACGVPVVATAVGGIPEQLTGCAVGDDEAVGALNPAGPDRGSGVLVPAERPDAMAQAIAALAADPGLRERLGRNAALEATARHGLDRQVDAYLAWYEEIRSAAR